MIILVALSFGRYPTWDSNTHLAVKRILIVWAGNSRFMVGFDVNGVGESVRGEWRLWNYLKLHFQAQRETSKRLSFLQDGPRNSQAGEPVHRRSFIKDENRHVGLRPADLLSCELHCSKAMVNRWPALVARIFNHPQMTWIIRRSTP